MKLLNANLAHALVIQGKLRDRKVLKLETFKNLATARAPMPAAGKIFVIVLLRLK